MQKFSLAQGNFFGRIIESREKEITNNLKIQVWKKTQ